MKTLSEINLNKNPFSETTPSREQNFFWAGMKTVKDRIADCYQDAIDNNGKQLILNWGPYGGGKTFSSFYFLAEHSTDPNLTQIYVRSPKDGSKATREIFNTIIDELTFDRISEQVRELLNTVENADFLKYLSGRAGVEFAKAIVLIGSDDNNITALMNRFLYSSVTATELKTLGLAKQIKTDGDLAKFLTGLLSCFSYDGNEQSFKLCMWFDEMEDLIYYSTKHYQALSQFLRDLYDNIPNNLLIFLNFTLAEGEDTTIELILGTALWSRIIKKIRFKDFDHSDALEYSFDLLNEGKIDKRSPNPMDKAHLKKLIDMLPLGSLTPREINKKMTAIIKFLRTKDLVLTDDQVINDFITQQEQEES